MFYLFRTRWGKWLSNLAHFLMEICWILSLFTFNIVHSHFFFNPYFLNRFAIWLWCCGLGLKQFVWHCLCSSSVTLKHLVQLQFDKFHQISLKEIWLYHHRSMNITFLSAFISIVWPKHNLLQSFFTKYFSVLHFLYYFISVFCGIFLLFSPQNLQSDTICLT